MTDSYISGNEPDKKLHTEEIVVDIDGTPTVVHDEYVRIASPSGEQYSSSNPLPTSEQEFGITALNVIATTLGDTVVATPTSGKKIRLWWYNMAAHPNNGAHVVASLKFGSGGTAFNKTPLSQYGAATAHSFKSGRSYIEGDTDDPLYVTLDANQAVYVNIDYEEAI